MNKWKKRVRTGVLRWRDRDSAYGFTNLREAGHVGYVTIDYIHAGVYRNIRFLPQVNLTALETESFQP